MAKSEKHIDSVLEIDENINAHQMIAMLLSGALTGIDEAVTRINKNDIDAATHKVIKVIRIVDGLRSNLNMEAGGEIAANLYDLYSYIDERLQLITTEDSLETLAEVRGLLKNVQDAWLGIEAQVSHPQVAQKKAQAAAHSIVL